MTGAPVFVILVPALVVLSVIDVRTRRLPTPVIRALAVVSIAWFGLVAGVDGEVRPLARALACGVVVLAVAVALHVAAPDGLGMGDVRLAGLLGVDLGYLGVAEAAFGLTVGVTLAAVAGGALVTIRARRLRDGIPLGPFLAVGAIVVILGAR